MKTTAVPIQHSLVVDTTPNEAMIDLYRRQLIVATRIACRRAEGARNLDARGVEQRMENGEG